MLRLLLLVALLLSRPPVWAQPTVGTACSGKGDNTPTVTVFCTATGSERWAAVAVTILPKVDDITAIAYGTGTPTLITSVAHPTEDIKLLLYGHLAPATGSQALTVDYNGFEDTIVVGLPLAGVDQTTPIGTANTASGTGSATPSVTVTSAATDRVIDAVAAFFGGGLTLTPGAGQTEHVDFADDDLGQVVGMSSEVNAGTTTMSWTVNFAVETLSLAVPVKAAAATQDFYMRRRQ